MKNVVASVVEDEMAVQGLAIKGISQVLRVLSEKLEHPITAKRDRESAGEIACGMGVLLECLDDRIDAFVTKYIDDEHAASLVCAKCGAELHGEFSPPGYRPVIKVVPCQCATP